MKRFEISTAVVLFSLSVMAQSINIHWSGTDVYYWSQAVNRVQFEGEKYVTLYTDSQPYGISYISEEVDSITFSTKDDAIYFVPDAAYESTDFSQDGKVTTLQKHEKGRGIPLVILCDAFSDRMISLGLFDQYAKRAMNAFFSNEPFTTFRDYFDVYSVTAVSLNERPSKKTAFGLGSDNSFTEEGVQNLYDYVLKIPELNGSTQDVTAIMISNLLPENVSSYYTWSFSNNFSVAQTCVNMTAESVQFNEFLVWHEAGGHGFGLLCDERVNNDASRVFSEESHEALDEEHRNGISMNIDYHDTPETVLWKDFMANRDYDVEEIGLYEGALYTIAKGLYRPSDTSIMYGSNGKHYYNAPSRWAIYQRIMKLAGKECKFEDFLKYDKKSLEAIKAQKSRRRSLSPNATEVEEKQINCCRVTID